MLDRDTVTHYTDDRQQARRTIVQAICGVYIHRSEHAGQPTCPVCRLALERRDDEPEPALRLR